MRFNRLLYSLALIPGLAIAVEQISTTPSGLYTLSADSIASSPQGNEGQFHEIKRDADASIIQLDAARGDGRSANLLMLAGFCGLMRDRQHKSGVAEQISVQPLQFRVTFPESPKIEDKPGPPRLVFSEKECGAITRHRE